MFDLNEKSCIQHQANSQTQTEDNNFILTITNPQNLRKYPPVVLPLQGSMQSNPFLYIVIFIFFKRKSIKPQQG